MHDDQMITALRETTHALTADVRGRGGSLDELLRQVPAHRQRARSHPAVLAVLAAAAVAASVVGFSVLATHVGGVARIPAQPGAGLSAGGPFPTSQYFLAQHGRDHAVPDTLVVRVSDGATVATLPRFGADGLASPVLSPDGTKVYAAWGTNPAHLGYYDFASGRRVVLDTRPGILIGPTVSADGRTLAYEWSATLGDPEHSTSIVIRDLRTGAMHVLRDAPAGPQVLSLALSPDGSRLALVPTETTNRPLLVVPTAGDNAFAATSPIAPEGCGSTRNAEPRWTDRGLYVLRFCGPNRVNLVDIDVAHRTSALLRQFDSGGITAYTPVPSGTGDLFVVSDESQVPPTQPVAIYDPSNGWSHRSVTGIDGLQEVTSE
jgi:hypothetical protein